MRHALLTLGARKRTPLSPGRALARARERQSARVTASEPARAGSASPRPECAPTTDAPPPACDEGPAPRRLPACPPLPGVGYLSVCCTPACSPACWRQATTQGLGRSACRHSCFVSHGELRTTDNPPPSPPPSSHTARVARRAIVVACGSRRLRPRGQQTKAKAPRALPELIDQASLPSRSCRIWARCFGSVARMPSRRFTSKAMNARSSTTAALMTATK